MNYELNIGKKVNKPSSMKKFKSGLFLNTVKAIIDHPILHIPAYTFEEDESYVECRRCEVVTPCENQEPMNYYKEITEGLREFESIISDREREAKVCMFHRFILLMGEEHFNTEFEYQFMGDKEFDAGFFDFHKGMRQVDFFDIGEGHVDMLFWEFIHVTDVPYKILKTFTEKAKIGKISEFDDELVKGGGWHKFGLFRALRNEKKA